MKVGIVIARKLFGRPDRYRGALPEPRAMTNRELAEACLDWPGTDDEWDTYKQACLELRRAS